MSRCDDQLEEARPIRAQNRRCGLSLIVVSAATLGTLTRNGLPVGVPAVVPSESSAYGSNRQNGALRHRQLPSGCCHALLSQSPSAFPTAIRHSPSKVNQVRRRSTSNPKYENQKSCFFLCLDFRFSEQNGGIQPEKVTRKIARKKVCIINDLYFLAERGGLKPRLVRGR